MTYSNANTTVAANSTANSAGFIKPVAIAAGGSLAALATLFLAGSMPAWVAILPGLVFALGAGAWLFADRNGAGGPDQERIRQALETCQTNVMIADADYNIVFMNETMSEVMEEAESDIKEVLKSFDARTLLGSNIDIFHENPSYQRSILDRLHKPHKTRLDIGARTFGLIASPVFDKKRQRIGTIVEWEDRTAQEEELKTQARAFAEGEAKLAALDRVQAVIEFELDGTIITANENFCAAMGYSLREIEGKHHSIFADPDYAASAEYREFWRTLGEGEVSSGEFRRLAKGGREIWIQASYNPVFDENGEICKIVKFATDITEEKIRTTDMTSQIEAISKSQAVIEFELDGTIITANENFCATVGYSLEEIRGKHHSMFVDREYGGSAEYRAFWDKLGRGEFDSGEYERVGQGGRKILIQASYNPIFDLDGNPYKVVKYATDLTRSDRMRENARIRAALDNTTTNVMVADDAFNIVYMNKSQRVMMEDAETDLRKVLTNFDARNLLGQNMDIFHRNPAHQRGLMSNLSSAFETDIKVGGRSFKLIASPVRDNEGNRVGTVVEWKDETAEKAIESEIQNVVAAVGSGDFTQSISLEGKDGFMLGMAESINTLAGTVSSVLDDIGQMLQSLSEGDLTRRIDTVYEGVFDELKENANTTAAKLGETVQEISTAAREVASGAEEITTGATDLSTRTEQQAANLEETAASMQEMASTIKQNADNSQQASQLAVSARDSAETGGQVVGEAVDAMGKIEESSRRISDIIGVIDEIAFQTNLLALNAAVEAARAGDAGRGFAVVASEVRSLAQRSAQAAKDIKDLIVDSTEQVQGGVDLVNKTGESLTEIVDSIKRVADIVAEISAASREQASGVDEINTAVTQMDEMTQQNSALVEENAAAAKTMADQASRMRRRMAFFKNGDNAVFEDEPVMLATGTGPSVPSRGARGLQVSLAEQVIDEDDDWSEF